MHMQVTTLSLLSSSTVAASGLPLHARSLLAQSPGGALRSVCPMLGPNSMVMTSPQPKLTLISCCSGLKLARGVVTPLLRWVGCSALLAVPANHLQNFNYPLVNKHTSSAGFLFPVASRRPPWSVSWGPS